MLGGYSFAVTLPRSWVLANEGKKISMFLDGQNRLVLVGVESNA